MDLKAMVKDGEIIYARFVNSANFPFANLR